MTSVWSQNSLLLMLDKKPVPVASYTYTANGRDGGPVLRPDPVRVKGLSRLVAQAYYDSREKLGFPMLPGADKAAA